MSRETVNSYALHVSLFFNMLSPLIRLITNHRDIMQQQLNFMPLLLYPGLSVVCSNTGKYTQIYTTKTVIDC